MKFKEAFDLMVRDGKNIKRKSWEGFWHWADGTIWITTRKGDTIDIRATTDVSYTIRNTFADDWEVVSGVSRDLKEYLEARIPTTDNQPELTQSIDKDGRWIFYMKRQSK